MPNVTVADILKIHGEWVEVEPLIALIDEKLGIKERQAYRKIKEAVEKKEIKKLPLPDGAFLYGLPEFGPPVNQSVESWNPPPDFAFSPKFEYAHRKIREPFEVDADEPPKFPSVPFNWHNFSPFQLRVRLEVRVFLGGKYIGLVNDTEGYYNGKASIPVEPNKGRLIDGRFTLPPECGANIEKTIIEVQ